MSATTYFGDVVTTGNTNVVQSMSAYGSYSYFLSNIVGRQSIGTSGTPFGNVFATSANLTTLNTTTLTSQSTVTGNLVASNAYQGGNLFASLMNVTSVSNVRSLIVQSNVGIGTAGGAAVTVQGNVYVSNAVTSPGLFATSMNVARTTNVQTLVATSNVGAGGANLNVTGNMWASNGIFATNVFATTANTSTLNVASLVTPSYGGTGNAMSLTGNMFVSNSLTATNVLSTNVRLTTANVTTMNAFSVLTVNANVPSTFNVNTMNVLTIVTPTGLLGIGTTASLGANLYVQGNVFVSNAFSGGNASIAGTLYYNEDVTKRSIHLIPSAANASAIQSWISASCNASSQPSQGYWSTSQAPVYGNVVTGPPGGSAYSGSVYLPDGRVLFVPANTANVGIYNPQTLTFTSISGTGVVPGTFKGGVLLPNGNVIFVPQTSNVGLFNPLTYNFSNVLTLPAGAYNGVLSSNGVVFTPSQGGLANVIIYTKGTTYTNVLVQAAPAANVSGSLVTWKSSQITSASPFTYWTSLVWSSTVSLFTAVGQPSNSAYSSDGINWTLGNINTADGANWQSIAFDGTGTWVAVGIGGAYNSSYSNDGINWNIGDTRNQLKNVDGSAFWYGVAYDSSTSIFGAIGTGGSQNAAYSSSGGFDWFAWGVPAFSGFTAIASNNAGNFVIVGSSGGWVSTGVFDFNVSNLSSVENITWSAVTYNGSVWVVVGGGGANYNSAWSTNTQLTSVYSWNPPTTSLRSVDPTCSWTGVTWNGTYFLAVGSGGKYNSAYSLDGQNWRYYAPLNYADSSASWTSVSWNGSFFEALAFNGTYNSAYTTSSGIVPNRGSLLLPSGNVVFSQLGSPNLIQMNPVSLSTSFVTVGTDAYDGLVLSPNGNVVSVPAGTNAYSVNFAAFTSSNISVPKSFSGGVLLPSGNVIFVPGLGSNVGVFNPVTLQYSNGTVCNSNFSGGSLIPSGQVVFASSNSANVGVLDTFTPVSQEFCLSPYFNKY